jgi:allophanate hydrolase subunit 1
MREIAASRVRVQTIGFAPGQPYLGELPDHWNIPRQQALTDSVPVGALVVAIRQLVLFSVSTPTGWRHIGQTAFRLFRPEAEEPFVLRPGDKVIFEAVERDAYDRLRAAGPDGGATSEAIR